MPRLYELNGAVRQLLDKYNSRRMQGCDYSRVERFLAVEKPERPAPPPHENVRGPQAFV